MGGGGEGKEGKVRGWSGWGKGVGRGGKGKEGTREWEGDQRAGECREVVGE